MLLYLVRMLLVGLITILCTVICFPICIIRPFNPKNTFVFCRMVDFLTRPILGHKFIGDDLVNFHKLEGKLFISNHQSNFDIFFCAHVIPPKTVSVGKKSLRYIPFFGQFYWLSGNILIDRSNSKLAISSLEEGMNTIKKYNSNLWIMPEGTRSKGRGLLKFKKGAFQMAKISGLPIVPVCYSSQELIDYTRIKSGNLYVKVLPEFYVKENDDLNEIIEKKWSEMNQTIIEINKLAVN